MKQIRFVSLLLALLLLMSGCVTLPSESTPESSTPQESNDYPVTVAGVTLEKAPERVVVLAPAIADAARDLAFAERVCGISSACADTGLTDVTDLGDQYALAFDRLTALRPDLILTQTMPAELAEWCKNNKVSVICLTAPTDRNSLFTLHEQVAIALGGAEVGVAAAKTLNGDIAAQLTHIASRIAVEDTPKTAAYLGDAAGAIAGGDTLWQLVCDTLHLDNVAADGVSWTVPADMKAPAFVICSSTLEKTAKEKWLRARVVTLDTPLFLCSGRTFVKAVQQLACTLYPAIAWEEPSTTTASSTTVTTATADSNNQT